MSLWSAIFGADHTKQVLDGLQEPAWKVTCGDCDKLKAEVAELENDNEVLTQEIHAAEDKVARLQQTVKDFMSYFDPQGGVSDVPLGPFERAKEDHPWLEDE